MKRSRLPILVSVMFILTLPPSLSAQYVSAQDSSLVGLKKVFVIFSDSGDAVTQAQAEELMGDIVLNLRKTGIRMAHDSSDVSKDDGVLHFTLMKRQYALTNDLSLRLDVEQQATLARTGESSRVGTWYYEDDRHNVDPQQVLKPMVRKAVDAFLLKWLDMNGR